MKITVAIVLIIALVASASIAGCTSSTDSHAGDAKIVKITQERTNANNVRGHVIIENVGSERVIVKGNFIFENDNGLQFETDPFIVFVEPGQREEVTMISLKANLYDKVKVGATITSVE